MEGDEESEIGCRVYKPIANVYFWVLVFLMSQKIAGSTSERRLWLMGKLSSVLSAPSGLDLYSSVVTAVTEPGLSKDGGTVLLSILVRGAYRTEGAY